MEKDIQELTENERYDLKRKQLKEEWNAYYNNLLDGLKTVENKKVVIEKESCNCFTCRHKDEPRVVAGYLQGYIDASDWFINWAEKNKIKLGSIADDDLGGIYAQMKCNRDESGCLLEEFPDLEKPIENLEVENQRLKEQLKDYKKVLRFYADGKHYHYNDGSLSIYIYKRRHGIIETDDGEYIESGKKAKEILEKWGKKNDG